MVIKWVGEIALKQNRVSNVQEIKTMETTMDQR